MQEILKKDIGILFVMSLLVGLIFYIYFPSSSINRGDEFQYNTIANNINKHNAFSLETAPPFNSTLNREPLYPFFLSLIYRIFGESFSIVMMIQILIFAITIILTYKLIIFFTNSRIAFYSSLFTAICPPLANLSSSLMSETLFIFLLMAFAYIFSITISHQRKHLLVYCGILLGILSLCKTIMLYFFPFLVGSLLLFRDRKKIVIQILLVSVPFILVVVPWLARNYYTFGTWKMTAPRGGMVLWMSGLKNDYSFEDLKQAAVYYFSENLGEKIYPDATYKNEAFMREFNAVIEGRHDEDFWRESLKKRSFTVREGVILDAKIISLKEVGFTDIEIDKILTKEALKKINGHPFKYLMQTPLELIKMISFTYLPMLNDEQIVAKIESFKSGLVTVTRAITRLIAFPILGLAFYGFFQYRMKWKEFSPVLLIIIYFNLFHGLTFGFGRYAVPLIPFYVMFATMGLFRLYESRKSFQEEV